MNQSSTMSVEVPIVDETLSVEDWDNQAIHHFIIGRK
jgi:hypothetical protein